MGSSVCVAEDADVGTTFAWAGTTNGTIPHYPVPEVCGVAGVYGDP